VGFVLSVIGALLMLVSLGGIALGAYMATDPATREPGKLFAIWWVSALAGASGVLMRDLVTFSVGALCFLVAGAVFTFESSRPQKPQVRRVDGTDLNSERSTQENRIREDRAAL
jgi:hypothetical protein